jgi:mannose-1-phosphate guanylyltransferase/phosphomannomutase
MAGGQGTRLWPLTLTRPKPLIPVMNRPVMAHILDWLRVQGFAEVLVTLHYRSHDIRRAFGNGQSFGVRITYSVEEEPLGTAGSVRLAGDWLDGEPFLIVSGDALTDVDLTALMGQHRQSGAWLTLGLKQVADPSLYGVVRLDGQGRVLRFEEKPEPGTAFSHLANTGIYCVEPRVLECVPRGQPCDWSRDVFPLLMAEGLPLFGHVLNGYWRDIGCIHEYCRGQQDALKGDVCVSLPADETWPRVWAGPDVWVAPGAVVEGPVLLGAGCRIERDALVLPGSILGEQTVVGRGACVWNAILGAGCHIGPDALVCDSVLDEAVHVGAGSSVSTGVVVGHGCYLPPGTFLEGSQRRRDGGHLVVAKTAQPAHRLRITPASGNGHRADPTLLGLPS